MIVLIVVLVVFGTEWGGFDVADRCEARNLNVGQDQQRSKTEDEHDDEDDYFCKELLEPGGRQ
jgi:hypothetical protein